MAARCDANMAAVHGILLRSNPLCSILFRCILFYFLPLACCHHGGLADMTELVNSRKPPNVGMISDLRKGIIAFGDKATKSRKIFAKVIGEDTTLCKGCRMPTIFDLEWHMYHEIGKHLPGAWAHWALGPNRAGIGGIGVRAQGPHGAQ